MSDEPPPTQEKVWQCTNPKCAAVLHEHAAERRQVGRAETVVCPQCGSLAMDVTRTPPEIHEDVRDAAEFFALIPQAFIYPFRGTGALVLIIGGTFFAVSRIAGLSPLGLLPAVAVHGYLSAYLFEIAVDTASGEEEPPEWPDFLDSWDSILRPFLLFHWALLCGFLPLMIFLCWQWDNWGFSFDAWGSIWVTIGAIVLAQFGVSYFPMALLAAAMMDAFVAVNPALVFVSIGRVFFAYQIICFVFGTALAVKLLFPVVLSFVLPLWISFLVAQFLSLYLSMVDMRMLGILYRSNRDALKWF